MILNEFYFAIMRYIYRQVNGRKHEAGIKCIIISPIVIANSNRYKIDPEIFQFSDSHSEYREMRQEYILPSSQ